MLRVLQLFVLLSVVLAFLVAPAIAGPSDPATSNSNGDHDIPQIGDLRHVSYLEPWDVDDRGLAADGGAPASACRETLEGSWTRYWVQVWILLEGF